MGNFFNSIVVPMRRIPRRGGMQGKTLEKARNEFNELIRSQKADEEGIVSSTGEEQPEPVISIPTDKKPRKKRARRTNKGSARQGGRNKGK